MKNTRFKFTVDNKNMSTKVITSVLYVALIVVALLNPGTQISQWVVWLFIALLIVHLVEFFLKKDVMQAAGGSMGHHFVQTMLFGFIHWKPLVK